jgi:predicted hydrocarbon binding protein
MSVASHGLFFREGVIFGKGIADRARENGMDYFEMASDILKTRGWVKTIDFIEEEVRVKGSIEVAKKDYPTCHKIRGIISSLYESKMERQLSCIEVQCESMGAVECIFKIDQSGADMLKRASKPTKIINNNGENREG